MCQTHVSCHTGVVCHAVLYCEGVIVVMCHIVLLLHMCDCVLCSKQVLVSDVLYSCDCGGFYAVQLWSPVTLCFMLYRYPCVSHWTGVVVSCCVLCCSGVVVGHVQQM